MSYYSAWDVSGFFANFQMTTDWPAGTRGELRYGLEVQDRSGYTATVPLEAVSIGPVPRSERLLTQIGPWRNWTQLSGRWPGFLDMCDRMGLTAVSCSMSHVSATKYPRDYKQAFEFVAQARQRGYKIVGYYMTMYWYRSKEETHCALGPGEYAPGSNAGCPTYRGEHMQSEIDFLVDSYPTPTSLAPKPICKPCLTTVHVELFGEYYHAIAQGCSAAGVKMPELGVYDFVAGTWYHDIWDVSWINEVYGINSEPSTYTPLYPVYIEYMGDEVRRAKLHMGPKGRVIPWMSPGDVGLFVPEQMRWAVRSWQRRRCYHHISSANW